MTGLLAPGARRKPTQGPDGGRDRGPVVVLTYAHAGAELLTGMLAADRSLACTFATGIIPLCHEAASTWQRVEGHGGPPSTLTIKSVRSMATTMITLAKAQAGASRWCETAFASPAAMHTFLQIFPDTIVTCLHRSLPGVYCEAAAEYPWGLGESPFWAYGASHPGNNVATIAAYWAARTEALLRFEADHAGCCLRVRYEDLAADPGRQEHKLLAALGLDGRQAAAPDEPQPGRPCAQEPSGQGEPLPASRMPPQLLAKVKELHEALAYRTWDEQDR